VREELGIELPSDVGAHDLERRLVRQRALVAALRHERVVHVRHTENARGARDLLAGESVRISLAVPPLMVRAHHRDDVAGLHEGVAVVLRLEVDVLLTDRRDRVHVGGRVRRDLEPAVDAHLGPRAVFSGIPLVSRLRNRTCGVWVVNIETGQTVGFLRFEAGVQEIFAVQILRGMKFPELLEWNDERLGSSYVLPDEALADVILRNDADQLTSLTPIEKRLAKAG